MGLRTASVRRPHVEVMAPALTETAQGQKFELPPNGKLEPASFIIDCEKDKLELNFKQINDHYTLNGERYNLTDSANGAKCLSSEGPASDIVSSDIMNPPSMGDQRNEMGVEKSGLDISTIHKGKIPNDVDQLLHTLSAALPDAENAGDLRPSVEDIMQVIKSIEGSEKVNNAPNDLTNENEEIFPIPVTDLANNLSSFEKELLENVDVMNMSIEDQQEEIDTDKQKESQANDMLKELLERQARNQRRFDFIRRRMHKVKCRPMGRQVSGEIAGIFENVNRLLRKEETTHRSSMSFLSVGPETPRPMSSSTTRSFLRKLDATMNLQNAAVPKQKSALRYFTPAAATAAAVPESSSSSSYQRNNVSSLMKLPAWPTESKAELQKVSAQLATQLSIVQRDVDSEATESSSGGESSDEMCTYNNPHQQYLAIQKRALWKYSTERAAIATRWTWLQAQVADLEYRIRQHGELQRHIRLSKGGVQLGGVSPPQHLSAPPVPPPVNGYRGQLPGNSSNSKDDEQPQQQQPPPPDYQCSRTRPLLGFRKRKLLQVVGLHVYSKKAARPSTVRCGCLTSDPCVLCTGRADPTKPRDPPETLSRTERMALTDPSFHPVFSLPEDISEHAHMEALMKIPEWQTKSNRMKTAKGLLKDPKPLDHKSKKYEHRKKYGRLLKPSTKFALTAKLKNKIRGRKPGSGRPRSNSLTRSHKKRTDKDSIGGGGDPNFSLPSDLGDEEVESIGNNGNVAALRSSDSPDPSPLLQIPSISSLKRNRIHSYSYDIDNIVIPYSVAASTRVEKLQYKEILTPKWRIVDPDYDSMFNSKNELLQDSNQDSDTEDLTEEAVTSRHDRCEHEEKKRFLSYLKLPQYGRSRSHKRTDSRAESSGANTPDPMSPHNNNNNINNADQSVETAATNSPMISPPATPSAVQQETTTTATTSTTADVNLASASALPSIAVLRRRTISQSARFAKVGEGKEEVQGGGGGGAAVEEVEVTPFEKRLFPIDDETFETMLQSMPENHQFQTNARSQDSVDMDGYHHHHPNYLSRRSESPDTESTESAIGDGEEDPNDPEWIDMEKANREKHKR